MRRQRSLQPLWDEELVFNEDYAHMLRPGCVLLMELVDLDTLTLSYAFVVLVLFPVV